MDPYETDLDRIGANHVPLSPLSLLRRTATVYPDQPAVIYGDTRYTWSQLLERATRLAAALVERGIGRGDTVAIMAPNVPAFYDALFGVAMAGAVINPLNIRLDAAALAFILDHGEAKVLLTDREFSPVIKDALSQARVRPLVIDIDDGTEGELLGDTDYERFVAGGDPEFAWSLPDDEWRSMALCYTSGTTGNPKGVVFHHRGAYLNAIGNSLAWDMRRHPVYLWTLPLFHCCGWCFPWTIALQAGTNVCLRRVTAAGIYAAIEAYDVTHFCGAPTVLNMIVNAREEEKRPLPHIVDVMTAGAAPPAAVLDAMEAGGFRLTHAYGLTETYGPAVVCAWKPAWNELSGEQRAARKIRQGVPYPVLEDLQVMDPQTMRPVGGDAETMGEVMFRGNIVMKGYLKNPQATAEAFAGGWFHSGDLGVMHPDRYLQVKDRSKDIIISGGENISTLEVENVLYTHPAILEAAVVARPDDHWGETPCAFVCLKTGREAVSDQDIIDYCRGRLAHFKCPKTVVFRELPKTSTGKIQKFKLREMAKAL